MGETRLQRDARERAVELHRSVGTTIRRLREDAGLTKSAVAAAAGIDDSYLGLIEAPRREASFEVLAAVGAVLGADLSVRLYPNTGPRIHDRHQAPMVETLIRGLHQRWTPDPEVVVREPARGVIDVVLTDRRDLMLVATEVQSTVPRLEQMIRWHREKEASLQSADLWRFVAASGRPATSRLLVLRATRETRDLARSYGATLHAAYPARTADVIAALASADVLWPGAGIVWMRVSAGRAELLPGPPRGVTLGR
jgi:transcriptional regulator with XRE-family HTH domain